MIGERAGRFCDEWFGDDPKVLEKILSRVLQLAPSSESALQRLSACSTRSPSAGTTCSRSTTARSTQTRTRSPHVRWLREAAQLAKDVANQPEKAIGYYQQLLPLVPDDAQVNTGLERLLERHERWADLIALWEGRLESSRRRIASGAARASPASGSTTSAIRRARSPRLKPLLAEADDDKESVRAARAHHRGAEGNHRRRATRRSICCARTTTRRRVRAR